MLKFKVLSEGIGTWPSERLESSNFSEIQVHDFKINQGRYIIITQMCADVPSCCQAEAIFLLKGENKAIAVIQIFDNSRVDTSWFEVEEISN
ncbi:MAG: hypothetical protein M3P22_00630 [bacterium]|nr:hypothetical protein [bacterium]